MSVSNRPIIQIPDLVAAVAEATRRLVDATTLENAGLRGRVREELPALARRKAAAVDDYEARMADLEQASEGFTLLSEDQRSELKALTGTLTKIADENALLLRVALATSRRLMASVCDAAKELSPEVPGYARDGKPGHGRRPTARTPALSFDRSL